MQYVIDASVVMKWFLPELHKEKADTLLQGFLYRGLNLTAPDVLAAEVGNVLWKRSVLTREISVSEAKESYLDFLNLGMPLESTSLIAEEAFRLATEEQHPVYDTLYVSLALSRGCELVTADETLVRKLGNKFPQIRSLGSL